MSERMIDRVCRQCGKTFAAKKALVAFAAKIGRNAGLFCSHRCHSVHRHDPACHHFVTCARCSKSFEDWANRVLPRKYCSHECAGVARVTTRLACLHCSKPFEVIPSVARRGRRFCSTHCVNESRKKFRYESTKGRFRKGSWLPIRATVLERDGHACVKCGATKGRLHAHHKIPWQESRNDSLENLETLCGPCHARTEAQINPRHKYYAVSEAVA